ncbi:MAG TPA: thiazole biosynthesis adenylyltransferase ThiF [Firmicutes bacterium]|nr:thiazole biosynthesis adenylyltransferase ThiF [Bacillota bacterium]
MFRSRYSRQVLFLEVGPAGQEKLSGSKAVVVGLGALGTGVAELLARAGVGSIRLIDRDYVEESNLGRQSLYDEDDCRQMLPKAVAAARRLQRVNSEVDYEPQVQDLSARNAEEAIRGASVVVDGTDNFETRYLLNEACLKNGIPWVYGACVGSTGMTFTILPHRGPCFRCFLPTVPAPGVLPTCDTAGILGPAAAAVAALEVGQALRVLLSKVDESCTLLKYLDVWGGELLSLPLARNQDCPCCVRGEFPYLEGSAGSNTTVMCGRDMVQVVPGTPVALSLSEVADRLRRAGTVTRNEFLVKAVVDDQVELIVFPDGRALVKGTREAGAARAVYARYLGM